MKRKIYIAIVFSLVILLGSCVATKTTESCATIVKINTDVVINDSYIGNGAQWDPYQLDYGKGKMEISETDWQKLYTRLDFMRPQFIRVMINTTSVIRDGKLEPEQNLAHLSKILNYCQSRGVTVMFGDWGGGMVNSKDTTINKQNIQFAAQYIDFLINQKGYTCIKYYNMINEPNGFWSSTDGNYSLWAKAITCLHEEMERLKLTDKLSVVGPDAAIWKTNEAWWIDSCATRLGNKIGLYDIHTYPSKITVNSGEYSKIISAYKRFVPKGKKIVMGEIGFKFVESADSVYLKENIRRANSKPYASTDDSQMFVYDYMYGTDMADALFQTINAGFSGSVVWMLDDAMHAKESPDKLKVWGFWNIFGEEYFGAEEEVVRPWFYAWSLLSKYIPAGAKVYQVQVNGDASVKAIAVEKDNKYMLAVVNVAKGIKDVTLKSYTLSALEKVKQFIYSDGTLLKQGDCTLLPNKEGLTLNLNKGVSVKMTSESLIVYTNFEY